MRPRAHDLIDEDEGGRQNVLAGGEVQYERLPSR